MQSSKKKMRNEKIVAFLLSLSAVMVVLPVIAIVYFLLSKGYSGLSWSFLTQMPRDGMQAGGVMPALVGTLYLLVGTLVFAVPMGILAAVYLTECAGRNLFTRLVRLSIFNLAGVPSIVYGLFGYGLFVLALHLGKSILAGSATLAVLILPVVISAAEEALLSVPVSFREASYAMGATKWQTIRRVVLPNAGAGIMTGVILGVGRAAGETAPIMFTAAAFYKPHLPSSALEDCMALPYHLYVLATEMFNVPEKMQWGTAVVLLALVLTMNVIATTIRSRMRKKRVW
ncbi:MAG TPA: phosphate ABC transporter permease PstA [Armatimonadota bacterium]|jgi:phosphate transport system permease protein